ncbi:MAG: ATP-binding protein [Saprospiraceae bacterium]
MEKLKSIQKIVLTGPESSGKTTLAQELSKQLDCPLVPEFARPYLNWLGRGYVYQDLYSILVGQTAWEHWYLQHSSKPIVVCDTDWTVINVWEKFGYGSNEVTQGFQCNPDTYYLLCSPDIPWKADPLREHPVDRDALYDLYHQLLQTSGASFTILQGSLENRIAASLAALQ